MAPDIHDGDEECLEAVDINAAVPRNYVIDSCESGDTNRDDVILEYFFYIMAMLKRKGRSQKKSVLTKKTYIFTHLLTPWCRVLPEQLPGLQLDKKFPEFHGTRRFITALTSVRQLSLSWASPIQSIYPHPTSWRSILILSIHLHLGLPSGIFPSGFPTKTLYTPLSSPIRATWTDIFISTKNI